MRLLDNKRGITFDKVSNMIYWAEDNIMKSYKHILDKQEIYTYQLITSNNVIENIYDEVNRE
jgi:hypothetical protein